MQERRQVMKCAWLLATFLAAPAVADSVSCHIIYGGENFSIIAKPTDAPYLVRGQKIGRYFEFKAAYVTGPAEFATISLYVYATSSGESVLIHQAKFAANVTNNATSWGFTGFNYVYEPSKSSELQYWCEKVPATP
ncbi:MAG: hypothetical protein ABI769_00700 [Pseudomonadota bacterium]